MNRKTRLFIWGLLKMFGGGFILYTWSHREAEKIWYISYNLFGIFLLVFGYSHVTASLWGKKNKKLRKQKEKENGGQ